MIIADAGTRVVVTERPAVRMTLIAVATLIHMTIMYCLLALAGFHYAPGFRIVRMIIPAMFYHALITPPAWWATRRYILWTDRWAPRGDI
jgi:hypothetical protein